MLNTIKSSFGYVFKLDTDKRIAWVEGNGLKSDIIVYPENLSLLDIIEELKELQHDLMDK